LLATHGCGRVTTDEIERVACEHHVHLAERCTWPYCQAWRHVTQ
jgi:hypothetical protein